MHHAPWTLFGLVLVTWSLGLLREYFDAMVFNRRRFDEAAQKASDKFGIHALPIYAVMHAMGVFHIGLLLWGALILYTHAF
jgi:hypothetical protein